MLQGSGARDLAEETEQENVDADMEMGFDAPADVQACDKQERLRIAPALQSSAAAEDLGHWPTGGSEEDAAAAAPNEEAVGDGEPGAGAARADAQDGSEKSKRQTVLLPSVFEGRPPVLFFSYTVACGAKQRPLERSVPSAADAPRLYYSHTDKVHEYNAVINILRQGGLHRVRAETQRWSLLWSNHPPPEVLRAMRPSQRTNHFPGSFHLGRKDLIWRSISRMQRRFGKAYNITPQAFVLPKSVINWEAARARQPGALWIWKPCSQSCGRGIQVLSSEMPLADARELARKRGVVQKYVHNPLLIDGYKFDLRIYVVVLSYDPLKVYINDEGLVRLATEKYSPSLDTLESRMMHLTNYSVNKTSPVFVQNRDGRDPKDAETGEQPRAFKWSLTELREHFGERGLDYDSMFCKIKDVVIKTLIAVDPALRAEWSKALDSEEGWAATGPAGVNNRTGCFEIYGFDVLVDSALKPWLLEVNICPSLSSGSPLDKRIKTKLVADALTLVGIRPPPSMWRRERRGVKRPSADATEAGCDSKDRAPLPALAGAALERRMAQLLACSSAAEAVAMFDQAEWELILDAHDEDMRSGGLERIFPAANSAQYTPFFTDESHENLVLRLWQEAGGGELFNKGSKARKLVPPWVPRQVCFTRT